MDIMIAFLPKAVIISAAGGEYRGKFSYPKTPYEDYSKNKFAIDYLQFPGQTLEYKAGDCDDLSILYSALLKSVGIETAFITIPGHIYTAVSLDIPSEKAKRVFRDSKALIFYNNNIQLRQVILIVSGILLLWKPCKGCPL